MSEIYDLDHLMKMTMELMSKIKIKINEEQIQA